MKVVFQGVSLEHIVKGKSRYTKAVVDYSYNGEPRKQTMMSFSNPTVFKQVQELEPGTEIEVDIIKNDAGYNEWKTVSVNANGNTSAGTTSGSNTTSAANNATRVTGSNYETREERAARQVLIVKQSSLSAAVATLGPQQSLDDYLERAQDFADWVFDNEVEEKSGA